MNLEEVKNIEFTTIEDAILYGKKFGGWIFHNKESNFATWYNGAHYTRSEVLLGARGSGLIATWKEHEDNLQSK